MCSTPLESGCTGCVLAAYHGAPCAGAGTFRCLRGPTGRIRALIAAVSLAAALGCGADEPAPAAEAAAPSPLRVLSLARGISEVLVELGRGANVVGADRGSLALPELRDAADLGAPDADALALAVALRPDLALFLSDDPSPPLARALEQRGIRSVVLSPHTANDVLAAVHRLGALLDAETRASALAARIARETAAVATRRDGRSRLRVAWLLRRDPPLVVGGSGLLHELLELAGAENVFHGPPAAPTPARVDVGEAELRASDAEVVLDGGGVPGAPPVAGARRISVPPELASLPALDLVVRVQRLHALLYPEESAERRPEGASSAVGSGIPSRPDADSW